MPPGNERYSVQEPFIEYATSVKWNHISRDTALEYRGGNEGLLFREILKQQLVRLNADFMTPDMAEEVVRKFERVTPNIEGNLIAWEYLKGQKTVYVPAERRERNVRVIDIEHISRNIFQTTDEFSFTSGNRTIRQDIVFLINGIPIFFVETKGANKSDGIANALEQVRRYHREGPELLAIEQFYTLTHIIRFYYSSTWNSSTKSLFNWKDEEAGNFETLVKTFCAPERIVRLLNEYILFTRSDDELKKVVLRPHQMKAIDKIVTRASDPEKHHALIWHTQGSGKTFTMIVAAQQILKNPIFENPTVLMLVDRNELESQLFGNLDSIGIRSIEIARSKVHLQELLQTDRRGLIVTMIHKFEGMPANINTRKNIILLVDEAHRTTTGTLGSYLSGALPNATYIGFTGTPIDKTQYGRGTFLTFGQDDSPKGYLDKYGIAESIGDGTTVPLNYTLAPNELQVDRTTLETEFLNLADAEGMSDIGELNTILERSVNLRNMMKNRERMKKIAEYVARHYREAIEPMGYKAFFVAVDREACTIYKQMLDEHLPPSYSEVVISAGFNDREELARFHISPEKEKQIRKDFRNPEKEPKILIVTEKLLTGFDAPVLYCMYLDKPMRDHVLLQSIARVNRPYENANGIKKSSGFVLDFVGIFDKLEKALCFDSKDIEGVLKDVKLLKGRFTELMSRTRQEYLIIAKGKTRDKEVEAYLEYFMDEEKRKDFYLFYREVSEIYDILSFDSFVRPFLEDFIHLTQIYRIVRENFDLVAVDRDFSQKVALLVQQHTDSSDIAPTLDICEINEDTLRAIEESKASDIEKTFNLARSILKAADDQASVNPYLISIGEKAEKLIQIYKGRQDDTQETLTELMKLIEEINAAHKEQIERKMSPEVFTVYWLLKHEDVIDPENKAYAVQAVFLQYPHWKESESHEREVRRSLYHAIIEPGSTDVSKQTALVKTIMQILKEAGR